MKKLVHMLLILTAFLIVTLFCGNGFGEYYKYIDENGKLHFTDDLSQVPPQQRENIESFPEIISPILPDVAPATEEKDMNRADLRSQLENRRKNLNEEFEALKNEEKALEELEKSAVTDEDKKNYNRKAVNFKLRISEYEEKRNRLNADIDNFNNENQKNVSED